MVIEGEVKEAVRYRACSIIHNAIIYKNLFLRNVCIFR